MTEIERRFLIRITDPAVLQRAEVSSIRQGYLTSVEPAVRVRESERGGELEYTLTIKAGRGVVRQEVEVPVGEEAARTLMGMAEQRVLEKVRHHVGRWDIDVFGGKLTGLILAEVELDHVHEVVPAPAGLELVREVTDDAAFTNQRLALLSTAEAAALARWVGRG